MKKKWWIIPVLLLLAGLGYGGFRLVQSRTATANGSAAAETTTETVVVTRGTLRGSVEGSGNVAALKSLDLAFASGGKVAEVLVAVGDVVLAGQPLARLETDNLEDAVTQAEISLTEAQLKLARTREGPSAADIEASQASLNSAKAAYSELRPSADKIAQAELSLQQSKIALESAQAAYDRAGGGWRAEVEYSGVATSLWQAQANYETELASYNALLAGGTAAERRVAWAKVEQSQANFDVLQTSVTSNTIRLSEISVEQAQIDLAKARRALEQATLVAPLAGTVTAVNVEVGGAAAGTAMVLSDLETLEVEITLDENDIAQVSLGQEAVVSLDAFDDLELPGTVVAIAPTANAQSGVVLYPVTVRLAATAAHIRVGMTADVEILTANVEDALLIPVTAVQNLGMRTIVLRKLREGETAEAAALLGLGMGGGRQLPAEGAAAGQRPAAGGAGADGGGFSQLDTGGFVPVVVELGARTATEVVVLSGLEEGDVLSVTSITTLMGQQGQRPFGGMPGMGPGAFRP